MVVKPKIIWSKQARESLKAIFTFYKKKSLQGAHNVKDDLLQSPKRILYAKQYQLDEINPNYYRIVVRDFKVLYKENNGVIQIVDIISTRQSPEILRKL